MGGIPEAEQAGRGGKSERERAVIFSGAVLVAARGSALPASCRGIGSANGNRTRYFTVQFGSVGSK